MTDIPLRYKVQKGNFVLDVATKMPASGVTGIFGASGSGKTTLLRAIAGLETCAEQVLETRNNIAMVFQDARLFTHLNVRGNIEYGWRRRGSPAGVLSSVIDLLDIAALLEREVIGLSGGEAQRVAIARALCQAPDLLLLDEPLSSLDQNRKDELLPYFDRLHHELATPMIYVSHSIDEICRLCDHLIVLNDGRMEAEGSLQAVLSRLDVTALGGNNAGSVIAALPAGYDRDYDLTRFEFSGGDIWIPGSYAAKPMRLRVRANDVSLVKQQVLDSTIQNCLAVTILACKEESNATQLLRLQCGDAILLSRITRRAWHQLQLAVGDSVYAQLKSVIVRR